MITDELTEIAQAFGDEVLTEVGTDYAVIVTATESSDGKGGIVRGENESAQIPVTIEPETTRPKKYISADKFISVTAYKITLPRFLDGELVEVNEKDRIRIFARDSGEPEKTYKVLGIRNDAGVVLEAICEIENQ